MKDGNVTTTLTTSHQEEEEEEGNQNTTTTRKKSSSLLRWAILRDAIVKSSNNSNIKSQQQQQSSSLSSTPTTTRTSSAAAAAASREGSIHRFEGFGFLKKQRLPRGKKSVLELQSILTEIVITKPDDEQLLITALELSLLALTALKPSQWIWEFSIIHSTTFPPLHNNDDELDIDDKIISLLDDRLQQNKKDDGRTGDHQPSSNNNKKGLRLKKEESGWILRNKTTNNNDDDDNKEEKDDSNNNTNTDDTNTATTTTTTTTTTTHSTTRRLLRIVLAPFVPTHGIFQYVLPTFDEEGNRKQLNDNNSSSSSDGDSTILYTRERLNKTKTLSLRELTSHHHHKGVDNTGNICVWDSEQTMTYCLLKHLSMNLLKWWPTSSTSTQQPQQQPQSEEYSSEQEQESSHSCLNILELGVGMAGLAGLSLAQQLQQQNIPFHLYLTDGHPDCVQNNKVHSYINARVYHHHRHQSIASTTNSKPTTTSILQQSAPASTVECLVLPWSIDPPTPQPTTTTNSNGQQQPPHNPRQQQAYRPPPCHVALVSDCTHFQEFHEHLFFTLAYGVCVGGYVYLCQPHRGNSLTRFLNVIEATAAAGGSPATAKENNNNNTGVDCPGAVFSIEWMDPIPELVQADIKAKSTNPEQYDPNIHYPYWIVLRKLREVQPEDHARVMEHMKTRD